jgi:hypothetical protein
VGGHVASGVVERRAGVRYDHDAVAACLRLFREKGVTLS